MGDYYLEVKYSSSFDEELNIINYTADIILNNIETDEQFSIGVAEFYLLNTDFFSNWSGVIDSADGVSGDLYEVVTVLSGLRDEKEIEGKILVLDSLEISEQHRNQGWGSNAMEEFLNYWDYIGIDYFALKPAPRDNELSGIERKRYIEGLIKFYSKLGFNVLENSEDEEPCMGRSFNFLD